MTTTRPLTQSLTQVFNNQSYNRLYLGLFGDSITQNGIFSNGTSPNGINPPEWFVTGATENYWRSWGWEMWVPPLSMQQAQIVRSWAVRTNGILCPGTGPAGYPLSVQVQFALADPLWPTINRAVILIGTNDCLQESGTPQQCVAALLQQIALIGKPVDLITSPPNSSQPTQTTSGGMWVYAWLLEWRALLKRVADASGGSIRFIDTYAIANTPLTSNTDTYATGYSLSDGIHPNNVYAYKIAQAWVNATYPATYQNLDIWTSNNLLNSAGTGGNLDQIFANPTFGVASGGTGTGTIAGSLTVSAVGTATYTGSVATCTIPNGTGNMQSFSITSAAQGDGLLITGANMHDNGVGGAAALNAGDQCWGQCLVQFGGSIFPQNINFYLNGYQNPTNYFATFCEGGNSANELALPMTSGTSLLIRTPVLTMPSGANFSNFVLVFNPTYLTSGTATINISNFEVRKFQAGGVY